MPFAEDIIAMITTIPNGSIRFCIVYNNNKCCIPTNTIPPKRKIKRRSMYSLLIQRLSNILCLHCVRISPQASTHHMLCLGSRCCHMPYQMWMIWCFMFHKMQWNIFHYQSPQLHMKMCTKHIQKGRGKYDTCVDKGICDNVQELGTNGI